MFASNLEIRYVVTFNASLILSQLILFHICVHLVVFVKICLPHLYQLGMLYFGYTCV